MVKTNEAVECCVVYKKVIPQFVLVLNSCSSTTLGLRKNLVEPVTINSLWGGVKMNKEVLFCQEKCWVLLWFFCWCGSMGLVGHWLDLGSIEQLGWNLFNLFRMHQLVLITFFYLRLFNRGLPSRWSLD